MKMATSNPSDTATNLIEKITVYRDIGVDTEGRAHLFDPKADEIVVCVRDVRGTRLDESDVVERIDANGKTPNQYARFVRDHVDGVEWADLDVLVVSE